MKVQVTYVAGASRTVEVEVPEDASIDDIDQAAMGLVDFSLCWQCGRQMDIGDPDLEMITTDDSDKVIYDRSAEEAELMKAGRQALEQTP